MERYCAMLTIGICDDEEKLRRALRSVVERCLQLMGCEYRILEVSCGTALTEGTASEGMDILFLDIEMPGLSGMDTAKRLRERGGQMIIIFVTAYPDFVFQGYEVHAFHYILKPYKEQKIAEVLRQALGELERTAEQYLAVEQKSRTLRLPLKEVLLLRSDKRKVLAVTERETVDFYGKLDEVEKTLPDYFFRIHNRYIVNLHFVTAVEKERCYLGQESYPVSRAYRQSLEVAFARMLLR